MTNKKSTKRALLFSVLSLVLCFSMLVGTTFAWFTDTVTSANNVIKSGNLDVTLEYYDGDSWETVEGSSAILDKDALWEPGYVEDVYFRIKNNGTLALKYQFGVNILGETAGVNAKGEKFNLSDYIMFGIIEGVNGETSAYADRAVAVAAVTEAKKISAGYAKAGTLTATDGYVYLAMVIYMPETVGNEANARTKDETGKIELGINIVATQVTAEEDAFGPDYDDGAFIPVAPEEITGGEAVTVKGSAESNITVTVPATVVAGLDSTVTALAVQASAPVVDTTNNTVTFTTVELVDQNGEEIDLSNASEKVTITLPVGNAFEEGEIVVIYHDGDYMATAVVANGFITYQADHFCEVTVGTVQAPAVEGDTVEIANAAELFGFAQSVNAGNYYEGKTVVLTADIDLNGIEWTPIGSAAAEHGFMGNFDGNGYVIKNLKITNITVDAYGYAYAGFFGVTEGVDADNQNYIKNLKIENVTIKTTGDIVAAAIAYPYYTTLENITVCGDIKIEGGDYTSGVLAYTRRCTTASNITVYGNAGSTITGDITVGGVISDIQMNGGLTANYSDFSASNVTVTGTQCVGGISGIIGGQTLNGATVENVTLVCDDNHVGIVSGAYDSNPVINDATYENVSGAAAIVGAPYGKDADVVTIDGVEYVGVRTADELVEALEAKNNVIFFDHIKIDPASMSNAYGATGINVKYGQTIDGNGYTLNIQGAGGTWDSGINTTGGVIKNITVTGSFRGIFINHTSDYSEKVVLDNVTLTGVVYTISCDQGLYQTIEATNCTFNGWTSFAKTAGAAKFVNCNFGEGSGYKYCRPYSDTEFVNCTFSEGYAVDTTRANVTFTDCTGLN